RAVAGRALAVRTPESPNDRAHLVVHAAAAGGGGRHPARERRALPARRAALARGRSRRGVLALVTGAVVVGTGFGCRVHVPALRSAGFTVHALVGRDPARTERRADRLRVEHACTSLADALALKGVDAVTIAAPPDAHAPLAMEACSAGRHVLCEKPFAL